MFYVSVPTKVFDKIKEQAAIAKTEIIGILVGRVSGYVLVVEDAISGEQEAKADRVALTPRTIAKVADKIMKGEIAGKVVGWYHSHPDMGIFLSATDIETQRTMQQFSPMVTALVIDPVKNEVGFFTINKSGNVVQLPEHYINIFDEKEPVIPEHFTRAPKEVEPVAIVGKPAVSDAELKALRKREQLIAERLERERKKRLAIAIVIIIVAATVIPAVAVLTLLKPPQLAILAINIDNPYQETQDIDFLQGITNVSIRVANFDANASANIKLFYKLRASANWSAAVVTVAGPTNLSTTAYSHYVIYWDTTDVPNGLYDIKLSVTNRRNITVECFYTKTVVIDKNTPVAQFIYPDPERPPRVFSGNVTLLADAKDYDDDKITVSFYCKFETLAWKLIGKGTYNETVHLYQCVWDTLTVIDGRYMLKVEVEDSFGLKFALELPYLVTVKNH